MNKRTGWNRRWTQSPNPTLEILEDRLVLSSPSSLAWQPLLTKIAQYGKLADSLPAVAALPSANSDGSPTIVPAAANLMQQISAGDAGPGRTLEDTHPLPEPAVTPAHTLLDIERVIIGWSPAPASLNITDVQSAASYALNLFSGSAPVPPEASRQLPVIRHEPIPHPAPVPIHDVGTEPPSIPPADTPPPREPVKAVSTPKDITAAATAPAPAERIAPQAVVDPNADAGARLAADAEVSRGTGANSPTPTGEEATKPRTPVAPAPETAASFFIANGFGQAITFRPDNFDAQERTPPEFITVSNPLDAGGPVFEEQALVPAPEARVTATPEPVAADLVVDFVPFDVANFHAAFESFLTELEQLCFGSGGRGWVGMGLVLASLVATGLTGQAAWERMRRRRAEDPDETADHCALWFLPSPGMPEPEVP
jgi:hypothetical protein